MDLLSSLGNNSNNFVQNFYEENENNKKYKQQAEIYSGGKIEHFNRTKTKH